MIIPFKSLIQLMIGWNGNQAFDNYDGVDGDQSATRWMPNDVDVEYNFGLIDFHQFILINHFVIVKHPVYANSGGRRSKQSSNIKRINILSQPFCINWIFIIQYNKAHHFWVYLKFKLQTQSKLYIMNQMKHYPD